MKHFRPYQPKNQIMLLPPVMSDWLPPDHEIHFIDDAVDRMDLSAIFAAYDNPQGYPPYHPAMMTKVLVYAYLRGIRSSRKIERALWEDVAMRVLSGNQQPDHWTLAHFRKRHQKALAGLFEQTVRMAQEAGLVKLGHVAVDGTKVKANASKHSAMSYGRMEKEAARLRAEIDQYFRDAEAADAEEDRLYGDRRGDELPPELADRKKRLAAIERAKAILEAEAREREAQRQAQAAEKGRKSRRPKAPAGVPKDKAQYNFTDPDSRIMRSSDKAYIQAYNGQVAVDAESQIIVAAEMTNQAADAPHLLSLVDQVQRNTGRPAREVSADAGYYSQENLDGLAERGIEAFIPPEKIRHSDWRTATPPRGRIPRGLDAKGRMRRKLRTQRGRARYKLRQQSVEPVFGQIKWNRGLQQLLLRGLAAAQTSWRFECAVHNLMKMWKAGVQWA